MATRLRPFDLMFASAVAMIALPLGVLAGMKPALAIGAAFGVGFVFLALADLAAGLAVFVFLTFFAQIPNLAGPAVSMVKLAGLWLVISWIARLAAKRDSDEAFFTAHPTMTYILILLVAWTTTSILWAESGNKALIAVVQVALNAILLLIIFTAVRERRQLEWVMAAFVIGATVSALYGLLNPPSDPELAARLSGTIGNPNTLAVALVAGLALCGGLIAAVKTPSLRMLAVGAAGICLLSLFLTVSRAGLISLAFMMLGAIVFGLKYRRRLAVAGGVVAIIVAFYFLAVAPPSARDRISHAGDGSGRVDLWAVGLRMVKAHPINGVGAGNFEISSVHYLLQPGALPRSDLIANTPQPAHNTYLSVFSQLGLIGFVLFASVNFFSLACGARAIRKFSALGDARMELLSTALVAALVGTLAANVFGSDENSKQLWLLLGLCPAVLAMAKASVQRAGADRPALQG